jgi:hypothetical protein
VTDVTHYFEAIRYSVLRRQLENIAQDAAREDLLPCVGALLTCLYAWSPYGGYGLPQNIDASSFLGNVVLDAVDKRMARDGLRFGAGIRLRCPLSSFVRRLKHRDGTAGTQRPAISNSSISKMSVAPPGITGGCPLSP